MSRSDFQRDIDYARRGIFKIKVNTPFNCLTRCQHCNNRFKVPVDVPEYPLWPYCRKVAWDDAGIDLNGLFNNQ